MKTTRSARQGNRQRVTRASGVLSLALAVGLSALPGVAGAEGETDEAVVLDAKIVGQLGKEEKARLDAAVTRALDEAQLQVVPPPNRDAILSGEPELRDCFWSECQDRIGRLLSAKAVLSQTWEVKRDDV